MVNFIIEKEKRGLTPEILIANRARKLVAGSEPKLVEEITKNEQKVLRAIHDGEATDVKKLMGKIQKERMELIKDCEEVFIDINVILERELEHLQRSYNRVKSKNPAGAIKLKEYSDAMISMFTQWFRLLQAAEKGTRTYLTANAGVLLHESKNLLWDMRYVDLRKEHKELKRLVHMAENNTKNPELLKAQKAFAKEAEKFRKLQKPLITHANTFEKDFLEANILLEKEKFEKEIEQIIAKLESSGFPKEEMDKIKKDEQERKKAFIDLIKHQEMHINTILKINTGVSEVTGKMKKDSKEQINQAA